VSVSVEEKHSGLTPAHSYSTPQDSKSRGRSLPSNRRRSRGGVWCRDPVSGPADLFRRGWFKGKTGIDGVIGCRDPVPRRLGPWHGLSTVDDASRRFGRDCGRQEPAWSARPVLWAPWSDSDHIGERLGPGSTSAARIRRTTPGSALVGRRLWFFHHPEPAGSRSTTPQIGPRRRRLWLLPGLDPGAAGGHKKCTRRTFFPAETGLRLNGCRGEVICRRRGLATPRTDKSSRSRRSFRVSIVVLA
jgi:hypothetical protein